MIFCQFLKQVGHFGIKMRLRGWALELASELVPGAYFPVEIQCEFSQGNHSTTRPHWPLSEIRDPVPAKFKHVTNIETCTLLCCDWITYVPALWNFQKSLLWTLATLSAKITPLFLLSDMRRSLQIFAWGMPLHAYVFSFTHNALVLSDFRCVHPENQTKTFLILTFSWIKTNVAYTRLEVIARTTSAQQVYHWYQTDLLLCTNKLLHPVSSSSKHGRWRSSLLLYSISMVHACACAWILHKRCKWQLRQATEAWLSFQNGHIVERVNSSCC